MRTLLLALFLSTSALAQDTGGFEITKNSFKDLYNQHRIAQPKVTPWAGNFFPYSSKGTAIKLDKDGNDDSAGRSPMEVYGVLARVGNEAHDWEKENHSCDNLIGELKKSCESWWGHCNGWAAAAIKELEPRKPIKVGTQTLSVAEQKGIYTELWLSSASLNAGWTDKNKKTGAWVHDHNRPSESYKMFWDVSPRAFFLIFTNYVGAQKTGVVVDRFTGDEVWNQPIVGHRFLPIRKEDISQVRDGSRSYWSALIRVKIYWANDLGTAPGHISKPFDIKKVKDTEDVEYFGEDYEGRYLAFRLNFDQELVMSANGTTVTSVGRMIGDGIWEHQENSRQAGNLDETHPDFIWLPTDPIQDYNGNYGNPYMDASVVAKISRGQPPTPSTPTASQLRLIFPPRAFGGASLEAEDVKKAVTKVIRREAIKHAIYLKDIEISRNRVLVPVRFPQGVNSKALESLFKAADMDVRIE